MRACPRLQSSMISCSCCSGLDDQIYSRLFPPAGLGNPWSPQSLSCSHPGYCPLPLLPSRSVPAVAGNVRYIKMCALPAAQTFSAGSLRLWHGSASLSLDHTLRIPLRWYVLPWTLCSQSDLEKPWRAIRKSLSNFFSLARSTRQLRFLLVLGNNVADKVVPSAGSVPWIQWNFRTASWTWASASSEPRMLTTPPWVSRTAVEVWKQRARLERVFTNFCSTSSYR